MPKRDCLCVFVCVCEREREREREREMLHEDRLQQLLLWRRSFFCSNFFDANVGPGPIPGKGTDRAVELSSPAQIEGVSFYDRLNSLKNNSIRSSDVGCDHQEIVSSFFKKGKMRQGPILQNSLYRN